MATHLAACLRAHGGDEREALILYSFEGADDPRYWLYAEAQANASLRHLDAFLRKIWLECCGHLSAFSADRRELAMSTVASRASGRQAPRLATITISGVRRP